MEASNWGEECGKYYSLFVYINTSEQSEWNSYYQSYIGSFDDIQTALKLFKNSGEKKIKYIFMIILELTELFTRMNRPDPTRPDPTVTLFDGLFLGKY